VTPDPPSTNWIGVDAGASKVAAGRVVLRATGLEVAGRLARVEFEGAFQPVPLERQREELARGGADLARGAPEIGPREREEAARRVGLAADAIAEAARDLPARSVRVAVCWPGWTEPEGRGTVLARNGPRIPDLLDRLYAELWRRGVLLAESIRGVHSDGAAAAWGEQAAIGGALIGVRRALVVGTGTGVFEALVEGGAGRIVAGRDLRDLVTPAWEMVDASGRTLEDRASMRGMNSAWRAVGLDCRLESAGRAGDGRARAVLRAGAVALGELIASRLLARTLVADMLLERVVVAGHAARLATDRELAPFYLGPLEREVVRRVGEAHHARTRGGEGPRVLRSAWLMLSRLAAPAVVGVVARDSGYVLRK